MHPLLLLPLLLAPPIRGVALAPHFEGERTAAQIEGMVDEIADLGATHIELVVQWGQETVESETLAPYRWGTDDDEVRRVIRYARGRGVEVLVFPIVRVAVQGPGLWRGKLRPRDRERWWNAYRAFVLHYARLAAEEGAALFSVGSELGAMEHERARWLTLIADVRAVFPGQLTYSANWDHFGHVTFWDALDLAGLNAYHPVTQSADPEPRDLVLTWRVIRGFIGRWLDLVDRPLLFTEVGYPSVDGGARRPYAYEVDGPPDLEEQRRAYEAFCEAWRDEPRLVGTFFWIWSGAGGPDDHRYTPRGKPAEAVLRRWFAGGSR